MLQNENRLTKVRDFNLVMEHGRWVNGVFLDAKVLELAKNQNYFPAKIDPEIFKKQLKIAFTVGIKVSKSAVKRNRARRQLREAVRLLVLDQKIVPGHYILFVARPKILEADYASLSQEVESLLRRAKVLL
jgi:ribonuclease P protein component